MDIANAIERLKNSLSMDELDLVFNEYLGKTGSLSAEFKKMWSLSPEEKKERGQVLSNAKNEITDAYNSKQRELKNIIINEQLANDIVDISLPVRADFAWHYSLLTQTRREVEEICHNMWFIVEHGHDIVTKFENFQSLNIPLTHPATEMHDTLYMDQEDMNGQKLLLRTHTTAMQNSLIKKHGLPLKVVIPGKVYRNENTDATHDTTFYQLDGLVIDKNLTIWHMIKMMQTVIKSLVDESVEVRTRPAYFPFVEPWIEMDARYKIKDENGNEKRSKRVEIVWAGMVHPRVLEQANIDQSTYSGFAFGFGINRLVAVRHGLKDIRYFTNGDLRFVRSF